MATTQMEVKEAIADNKAPKTFSSNAGTDGGWIHTSPLKTRFGSSTGLMSFTGESAWTQYDPHIVVPKEWGQQAKNWQRSLRDWPEPDWAHTDGKYTSWKHANILRWPLRRIPKSQRTGVVVNL